MKDFVKWLKLGLKFSFAFLIMGYMVYSGRLDLNTVRQGFAHGNIIALCFVLITASALFAMVRWRILMRGHKMDFTFWQTVRYTQIGAFFNTTMPGAVSGDIIKAWYVLADHKQYAKTPVLTSILLDRVMGVFGLIFVSAVPLLWNWRAVWATPELHHIALLVGLLGAGEIFFFLYITLSMWGPLAYLRKRLSVLESSKIGDAFLKFYDAWMHYRHSPGILFRALMLSVCTHLCVLTLVILCAHALGETQVQFYQYFLLVPIGLLTTAVPVAPAGLGVGHVAFGALFHTLGSNNGAAIFTLYVTIQICFNLTGVFFYLSSPKLEHNETVPQQA